jgi:predicted GNAT family acetyltransferase
LNIARRVAERDGKRWSVQSESAMNLEHLHVIHNDAAQQFELRCEGRTAVLAYHRCPGLLSLDHTGVPASMEGQGVAAKLTQAALEYARAEQLQVAAVCSYSVAYLRKHPEYRDLVAQVRR